MALCSLPRTNPRQRTQYVRRNGPYTRYLTVGGGNKLPYGNIPRLLLAWACTEAVRMQRRELVLGRSLYEFMRRLGMEDRSGGINGQRTRLRNQMTRLFRCTVQLVRSDGDHEVTVSSLIADKSEYWWHAAEGPDRPGAVRFHDPPRGRIFQRGHRAPDPDRHEHPARPKTLTAGPRFIRVIGLSHLYPARAALPLLASSPAPVRGRSGEREL